MPIYAYRCTSCGHAQDVLQRISDPLLSVCPACGAATYAKQLTAAGFQLKGSGWYVTDFRGDNKAKKAGDGEAGEPAATGEKKVDAEAPAAKADGDGGAGKGAPAKGDGGAAKAAPGKGDAAAAAPAPAPAPAASSAPAAPAKAAAPASGKTGT